LPDNQPKTAERQKKEPDGPKDIGAEIDLFVQQIDALADTLPLATKAIQAARFTSHSELGKFFKEECVELSREGRQSYYQLQGNQYLRYQRFQRRIEKADLAEVLVPRGLLVAMVSQFDAFVGGLIRQLFRARPKMLDASGKQLTFAQLSDFGSIEAAREYIVEKEIEGMLRDSHGDLFDRLESMFKIELRKGLPAWPVFIELTERRNLFVHTNGMVSRQYLDVCGKHSCQVPVEASIGKPVPLPREYFSTGCDCLLEIGVKLGQVLWRKVVPTAVKNADENLVKITYTLLTEGRYQLARVLLDFATETLKNHSSELVRLTFVINRAQTYKWTGLPDKCGEILGAEDWTATEVKFRLGHAVLRDDFEEACRLVRQIGKGDVALDTHAYREWPLFRELRKSPTFAALFEEMFGEPLNRFIVEDLDGGSSQQRPN
jgi:hypothetical protein